MRCMAVVVLGSLLTGSPTSAEPDARGVGWDTISMDLEVFIEHAPPSMKVRGDAVVELGLESSLGPTLALNFFEAAMAWTALQSSDDIDVEILNDSVPQRLAHLRRDDPFERGERLEIEFELELQSPGMQLLAREDVALGSWTAAWYPYPTRADPADYGVHLISVPGATTLHLPAGWIAISDGALRARSPGEQGSTEVWEQGPRPVARSFAAGPFRATGRALEDGRVVRIYLLNEHPLSTDRLAELLSGVLRAQVEKLGTFPFEGYGVVEVPDDIKGWYAASQQTFIMARSSAFGYEHGNLPLWAHEMCHAWWGNTVPTGGPGDKAVGEALAQYGAVIAIESIEGHDAMIEFLEFSRDGYNSRQCAKGYFEMVDDGLDAPLSALGESGLNASHTHNLANSKGMWVYHMLRGRIGTELFFLTLRELIDSYQSTQLTLDNLRAAFQNAAPDAELEEFFNQWLDRTGAPELELEWENARDGVSVVITQRGEPYTLSVEIGLELAGGERVEHVIDIDEPVTRAFIPLGSRVERITLDPNRRVLLRRDAYGPGADAAPPAGSTPSPGPAGPGAGR